MFNTSNDGNITVFVNLDGSVYIKKASMPDKEKLTSKEIFELTFSNDNHIMAYLDEYREDSSKGELMLLIEGYEKAKIASDVTDYQIPVMGDYIYFLNEDKSLYVKEIKDIEEDEKSKKKNKDEDQSVALKIINPAEKVKLDDDIIKFIVAPDGSSIIYLDTDDNLFLKRLGEQKIKIGSDVSNIHLYNNTVLFRDKEETLYTIDLTLDSDSMKALEKAEKAEQPSERPASTVKDKVKIGEDIDSYSTDESLKYLVYKTTSGELYLRTELQPNPVKVIDQVDKYNSAYFLNNILYEKLVTLNSITGYWRLTNEETKESMHIQFTKDSKTIVYDEQGERTDGSFDSNNPTSHTIDLSYSDGSSLKLDLINKDTLAIQFDEDPSAQQLTRVTKEEVDKYIKTIKDKAENKAETEALANNTAQTVADAIQIVESLDSGNYTAFHDSDEYDLMTVDGAFYYYINYSAASGMGGDVFVRKGTDEVYGYTMGTEDDPDAPFPDFSNQIK